ncbi:MAG: Asp23/Gls24 family envelope stress response protein, partial [Clostridia bacterium]|nr:Asp23/Gls24 family envelope stress response protein [Clostridia bacterium]
HRTKYYLDKGVNVVMEDDGLVVELHIVVTYGVNISTIVDSIVNKVRYTVEDATGLSVKEVNVFVDSMNS